MNWNLYLSDAFVKDGYEEPPSPGGLSTKSLDLNGSDEYVTVPGNATLRGFANGDVIVIDGWIRLQELTSAVEGTIIMNEESPGSDDSQYAIKYESSLDGYPWKKFTLSFQFMDGSDPTNAWYPSASYPFWMWRWYHIAVKHEYGDASTTRLYVNGVSQAGSWTTGDGDNDPVSNSEDIILGYDAVGLYGALRMDQFQIFKSSTDWSEAELQELYDDSLGSGLIVPADGREHSTRSGDIIAQWTLGENDDAGASGIKENVNSYHGTGTNLEASSFSDMSAGYYGVQFGGSTGNVSCGSGSGIDNPFAGGGSASAWVMPFSDGEGNNGRIMSKTSSGSSTGWWLYLSSESGGLCQLRFQIATTGTFGVWRTTSLEVPIRQFTQVGVVFNSTTMATPTLIVNGESVPVTVVTAPTGSYVSDASDDLMLGNYAGDDRTFAGQIYSAAIWLSGLTATHWEEVYNGTAGDGDTGQPPDLMDLATASDPEAWWMWEGAIAAGAGGIPDLTGNGHDATKDANVAILNVGP